MSDDTTIKKQVQEKYGALADKFNQAGHASMNEVIPLTAGGGCCGPVDGCASTGDWQWGQILYQAGDLSGLPASVTGISLGCGNPTAIANLKPGETVLDLGSGGGIDCFLAAQQVGPTGRVIGVDMTDSMLALANQNKAKMGLTNVEFRKGEIENLPVDSGSVDVIISNCVINLSPDKDAVFAEAWRVLKPGGRLTVSDMVTEGEFPEQLRRNIQAWAGCITGALDQGVYLQKLAQAGFVGIEVESRTSYGLEQIDRLDEASRKAISQGVDWNTVPADVRLFSAKIIARKA